MTEEGPGHPATGLPSFGFRESPRSPPTIDNPNDAFAQYEAQVRLRAQLAREVTPLNKAALFTVLQAAGIRRVTVHFDGAGDSGQTESTA